MAHTEVMSAARVGPDVHCLCAAYFPKPGKTRKPAARITKQLKVKSEGDCSLAHPEQALVWSHVCVSGPG